MPGGSRSDRVSQVEFAREADSESVEETPKPDSQFQSLLDLTSNALKRIEQDTETLDRVLVESVSMLMKATLDEEGKKVRMPQESVSKICDVIKAFQNLVEEGTAHSATLLVIKNMASSIGRQARKLEAEAQRQSKDASRPDPAITTSADEHTPIIAMWAARHPLTLEDGQSLSIRETQADNQVKPLKAQVSQKGKLLKQLRGASRANQKQRGGGEHDHGMRYRCGKDGHKSFERKRKPEGAKKHREARRKLREEGKARAPSEQPTSAVAIGDLKKTWPTLSAPLSWFPPRAS